MPESHDATDHLARDLGAIVAPGLYLEDLYVRPGHRGSGLGKALPGPLGRLAVERGCGRFEWSVLDWRICRISGERLARFAKAN